ncbi:hypothetical protein P691DRAFT_659272 [Macrolepiota fuliginosa MF-IS2]|uniref:CENP-V/GFA domain-containing protein n=1 Tax=Macrolepiota fuliginosa MF-IS2 TaxID=1400762 RepID=A0A9P5XLV7_9AGAR|nr:hypothetical protein P691DRAFT_659272 [Macrolepiota fuliginosa MF-IS2]
MVHTGSCTCGEIRYELALESPEDGRTSMCYCEHCRKWSGSAFGITTKVPKDTFRVTAGTTGKHVSDNDGTKLYREFCRTCGSGILEYGEHAADKFRYVTYGTLDQPEAFPPKGEFFCKYKAEWMPEIPNIFHKQEIKE